jgi:hypothetical protein
MVTAVINQPQAVERVIGSLNSIVAIIVRSQI